MFEITLTMWLQCICLHWEGVRKCGVSVPPTKAWWWAWCV